MVTRTAGVWFRGSRFRWTVIIVSLSCAAAAVIVLMARGPDPELKIQADRAEIRAGGVAAHFTVRSSIPLPSSGLGAVITEGAHSARISRTYFDDGVWHVTVQSKALPGTVRVKATLDPFRAGTASIMVTENARDSVGDGTPDVLRLDDPADATAFRSWFAFLAEAQFFRETPTLPAEIADCAGLIRYAYREALRGHSSDWARTSGLPLVPAIASVRKYEYPFTGWGAKLFRTGAAPGDLAEFADAETLLRYNTHFVARDIRQARRGDLIFFHQADAVMPYHSIIYLGASQIENAAGPYVVYHTGPSHESGKGEIRRPRVAELQKHPDPAWHLSTENTHYLGVYRWNILWE
jgi:uncharacterized protein YfaT (DUF1175 family)